VIADTGPRAQGDERRRVGWWSRLSRARRVALVAAAVVVFLILSGLLARFLSTENAERDAVLSVLRAEAGGDEEGMLARLRDCAARPACAKAVRADAASLHRRGPVKILSLTSHTAYSLTGGTGVTRVAWTVIGHLPTVQCVRVRRTGNFVTGVSVALLSIGTPINNEADC
jgi:hypothetical protein